jgi:hypothetical protein
MTAAIDIRAMMPADALAIVRQPSQRVQVGLEIEITPEIAADLIDGGAAWAAIEAGTDRVVALMGLRETFPGKQAVAWAVLSDKVGPAHLAITRHARLMIAQSPLVRIEAIVRLNVAAECDWARMVGLEPVAVLRKFGALSEDHVLYERIL